MIVCLYVYVYIYVFLDIMSMSIDQIRLDHRLDRETDDSPDPITIQQTIANLYIDDSSD